MLLWLHSFWHWTNGNSLIVVSWQVTYVGQDYFPRLRKTSEECVLRMNVVWEFQTGLVCRNPSGIIVSDWQFSSPTCLSIVFKPLCRCMQPRPKGCVHHWYCPWRSLFTVWARQQLLWTGVKQHCDRVRSTEQGSRWRSTSKWVWNTLSTHCYWKVKWEARSAVGRI